VLEGDKKVAATAWGEELRRIEDERQNPKEWMERRNEKA